MQKVFLYAKNHSRELYRGNEPEKAREIAEKTKGRLTLTICTLTDPEKGNIELTREEFSNGRSLGARIFPFEDPVMANIIFPSYLIRADSSSA